MASDGNQRLNEGELLRSMYHYLPGKGDLYCASLERGVRTRANVPGGLAARPAQPARAPCPCRATLWRSGRPERPLRALRRHCGELRPRERCGRPRGPIWEDFSFLARRVAPLTRHASASSPLPPRAQVPPEGATAARSAQQNRSASATGAAAAGQQKHADAGPGAKDYARGTWYGQGATGKGLPTYDHKHEDHRGKVRPPG